MPIPFPEQEHARAAGWARCNNLSGVVPDLSALTNLANNSLGPAFPRLGQKVAGVVLSGNRFGNGLPAEEVASFYLLKRLDVSRNRFVGPFPPALLALPSIEYLSVAGNRLIGLLAANMSCGENLRFVDVSSNLLTGTLPSCLTTRAAAGNNDDESSSSSGKVTLLAASNRLSAMSIAGTQHPALFCQNQALAVGIVPVQSRGGDKGKAKAGVVDGAVAAALAAALLGGVAAFLAARKAAVRRAKAHPPRRLVEHAALSMSMSISGAYPSQLFADARYISQTVKLQGVMGQDAHGQMYRGTLSNGTAVTIRSLRVARRGSQAAAFNRHVEMISRLRHRHLVSALGHCFEYNLDDTIVTQLYLVFEYVHNGNLRSWISPGTAFVSFPWVQRILAATGVARGIQFLHGGIMQGLFANNLNIYDFGVIPLEVVTGRPITSIRPSAGSSSMTPSLLCRALEALPSSSVRWSEMSASCRAACCPGAGSGHRGRALARHGEEGERPLEEGAGSHACTYMRVGMCFLQMCFEFKVK
ncbi:probable inactive leucine-rich repeat receptor-like protein kinase At3g03770 [Miscanthus floridulus]|uniref:probable inactive leucine-rich repeat receptor-like protein kinase At3g03770 n=1 Tax=Miscanthus floridulus TaxID=154761 RepID=UPI003457BC24